MLFLLLLGVFVACGMVTASLEHSVRGWRYAMSATVICAGILAVWTAQHGQVLARYFPVEVSRGVTGFVATLPFAAWVVRLAWRRRRAPRHVPSPDDDPVYRRYREEKLRRRRRQRQQEASEEAEPEDLKLKLPGSESSP